MGEQQIMNYVGLSDLPMPTRSKGPVGCTHSKNGVVMSERQTIVVNSGLAVLAKYLKQRLKDSYLSDSIKEARPNR